MKKKLLFKFFVFAVIGSLLTVTSCKDYDDDINGLDSEISQAQSTISTLQTQLTALQTALNTAQSDATAAKAAADAAKTAADAAKAAGDKGIADAAIATQLANEAKAAVDAAKAEAIEAAADELAALKTELEKAIAKKLDIEAFDNAMLLLDARIDGIEDGLGILTGQMTEAEEAIADLIKADAQLQLQLDALKKYAEETRDIADQNKIDIAQAQLDIQAAQLEIASLWVQLAEDKEELLGLIGENADNIQILKGQLEALEGKHATDVGNLQSQIDANTTSIDNLWDQLAADKEELLGLIGDNATNIAKLFTDLEATNKKIDDLKAEINAELVAIKDDISDIQGDISDIYDIIAEEIRPELVTLGNYVGVLDRQVKSITFVPDYTSKDGTPQILVRGLYEWDVYTGVRHNDGEGKWDAYWLPKLSDKYKMDGDIYKGYTELTYDVNPSNAILGVDYEVVGLLEKVSTVTRSSGDPLLEYVDAFEKDGKLVVRALVHKNAYNFSDDKKVFDEFGSYRLNGKTNDAFLYTPEGKDNTSVALQVKNKKELAVDEDRLVVSSEYVRSRFSLEPGFIRLVNDEIGALPKPYTLPMRVCTNTLHANFIGLEDYPVDIKLWNGFKGIGGTPVKHVINLNDYIKGIFFDGFEEKLFTMDDYGFEGYKFVFERIYLDSEGVNQTNDYVTLNEETGAIDVKFLADGRANQAAGGRTPIVLAKLMYNGKVYAAGYIKILITDDVDRSDVPFTFDIEDYILDCKSAHELSAADIATIDFDQVFSHARIDLPKDQFFEAYDHTTCEIVDVAPVNSFLNISDYVTFEWNMNFKTQTGDQKNFLKIFIKNTIPAGTYAVKTKLLSKSDKPDIVITWNFTVKLPEYTLTDNPAYLSGNKIIVNPTIGEQDESKTSAAYEALLNNAFMHSGNSFKFTPLPGTCTDALTPYFVFTTVPSGYAISSNGTKVYKSGNVDDFLYLAAEIVNDDPDNPEIFFIRLNNDNLDWGGSWGNYSPLSPASKGLVGKSVSIQPRGYINGAEYNWINLRTPFNVEFTYPLALNLPTDAAVYDQSDERLNEYTLNLYNPVVLADWKGREVNINTDYGLSLIDHYEIGILPQVDPDLSVTYSSPFVFDIENAKCNINDDGVIVSGDENIKYDIPALTKIKFNVVDAAGSVTVTSNGETFEVPTTFTFIWENNFTGAVQNDFKIAIPVTVDHKWGSITKDFIITVKQGIGPSNP